MVSLGSVPMAVPHTRPVQLTNHATSDHLLTQENVWRGELRVPSSAQALLELRLGEWGIDALGWVAHIPHYVAQLGYPLASVALLDAIGAATGLSWDVETLREAGAKQTVEIETQLSESERGARRRTRTGAAVRRLPPCCRQRVQPAGGGGADAVR